VSPPDIDARGAPRPRFAVQALVLDLDGTCLDEQQRLHPRTEACVRSAAGRLPVLVATGRMYRSALPWANRLGTRAPLVCYQGALVRAWSDAAGGGAVLYACELAPEPALRMLHIARGQNWHVNAYQDDRLLCDQDRPEARLYAQIAGVPVDFVADLEPLLARGSTKLVCVIEDPAEVRRAIDMLREALGGSARVTQSMDPFVEVVDPAVSKAVAIDVALRSIGCALSESVAIGDAPNDVEMLQSAGFAVAVRSHHPAVEAVADATCAGPGDAGVAQALTAIGLCAGAVPSLEAS
jgi:Cof subfamily protein (haloacid dehalogenase superfamily)